MLLRFRQFTIAQSNIPARVGTDSMLLGSWAPVEDVERILDIGTGSGIIALMLAQRAPAASVDAVEIHLHNRVAARVNFRKSPWSDRVKLVGYDFLEWAPQATSRYDLIVSNPPYFEKTVYSRKPHFNGHTENPPIGDRASWRQEYLLELRDIFRLGSGLLQPAGRLALILPAAREATALAQAREYNLYPNACTEVHMRPEKPVSRVLLLFSKTDNEYERESLTVQIGGANEYSPEYTRMTRDFYPWME